MAAELEVPTFHFETYVLKETNVDAKGGAPKKGAIIVAEEGTTSLIYSPKESGGQNPDRLGTFELSVRVKPVAEGKFKVENAVRFVFPKSRWPVRGDAEFSTSTTTFEIDPKEINKLDEFRPHRNQTYVDSLSDKLSEGILERFRNFSFKQRDGEFQDALRRVVRELIVRDLELLPDVAKSLINRYPHIVEQSEFKKEVTPAGTS